MTKRRSKGSIAPTEKTVARFRVDPLQIRVSVRRVSAITWEATVATRRPKMRNSTAVSIQASGRSARAAIMRALKLAEYRGFPGMDLGMEYTYTHPFRAAGVKARAAAVALVKRGVRSA